MNAKLRTMIAAGSLAAIALMGCVEESRFVMERNAPIAQGYDIALDVRGEVRDIRVGTAKYDAKGKYVSMMGGPLVNATSIDGDSAPEKIELQGVAPDSDLREMCSPAHLAAIGDHLYSK